MYLNKTFKNIRIGNWGLLSKCLRWILTNEPRNSVNLATNLNFFFSILKIGRFRKKNSYSIIFNFVVFQVCWQIHRIPWFLCQKSPSTVWKQRSISNPCVFECFVQIHFWTAKDWKLFGLPRCLECLCWLRARFD